MGYVNVYVDDLLYTSERRKLLVQFTHVSFILDWHCLHHQVPRPRDWPYGVGRCAAPPAWRGRLKNYFDTTTCGRLKAMLHRSLACYLDQPISWRCGRQSLIALSVAEAELIEAINSVQMMQGLAAFTSELQDEAPRMQLRVDKSGCWSIQRVGWYLENTSPPSTCIPSS